MAINTKTTGTEALARLQADATRANGVTEWCDRHRPDLEMAIGELGHVIVARGVNMFPSTLAQWCERRRIQGPSSDHDHAAMGSHDMDDSPLTRLRQASPPPAPPYSEWFTAHQHDLVVLAKMRGWRATADLLGVPATALYGWKLHRLGPDRKHRAHAQPAQVTAGLASQEKKVVEAHPSVKAPPKRQDVPYPLWSMARDQGWKVSDIDILMSCKLKRVDDRTIGDWQALAAAYYAAPGLFVDARGRPLPTPTRPEKP